MGNEPEPNGNDASSERRRPNFSTETIESLQGSERHDVQGATWRGWVLGILVVVGLCIAVPHIDYVIRHTKLSYSLFPYSPIFVLFMLVILSTVALAAFRTRLRLTRQDLVLVFSMGLVINAIPGAGLCSVWLSNMCGSQYYARPENRWNETLTPRFPESWTPHDPKDPRDPSPRPIEWFFNGKPTNAEVPWQAWFEPFMTWAVPFACLFMLMFGACMLLRRQWSERERLPYPMAQLPEELTGGLSGGGSKPFLYDRAAQWGIGLMLALHLWNGLQDYHPNVPQIPLKTDLYPYLSERPWSGLNPLYTKIYPSVIGLTFLLSLEVSFSLWFFFIVMKIGQVMAIQSGLGTNGSYFWGLEGNRGMFVNQGVGALLAMVLMGVWVARTELWNSLREALGLTAATHTSDDFPTRVPWLLLLAGTMGSVVWLAYYGASPLYSLPATILLVLMMVGFTRVFCEAGVFYAQVYEFPMHMVSMTVTPSVMGSQNWFLLTVWDRVMVADSFRVLTMPNIMNALHLASHTGLRRRSVVWGLALAITIAVPVGLGSLLYTGYHLPGGAKDTDWAFRWFPTGECNRLAGTVEQIEAWEMKNKAAAENGVTLSAEDRPDAARRDWRRIGWIAFGGAVFLAITFLRSFLFWVPHPVGYVVWMGQWPLLNQWFSFLLGWCCKVVILKWGGMRFYQKARRFFIGVVVGEAVVAIIWLIVAYLAGHQDGYRISID